MRRDSSVIETVDGRFALPLSAQYPLILFISFLYYFHLACWGRDMTPKTSRDFNHNLLPNSVSLADL